MRTLFEQSMKGYASKCRAYPFEQREFYSHYLAQTYFFVRHSTRLLAAAIVRLEPEFAAISSRFQEHLSEEDGHEMLAERDLSHLGRSLKEMEEFPETRTLYECQYFKIEHRHPLALMGYIIFLEGLASTAAPDVFDRVQAVFPNSCTFLKVHCEDDATHIQKALSVTDSAPPAIAELMKANFTQSAISFFHLLDAVRARSAA